MQIRILEAKLKTVENEFAIVKKKYHDRLLQPFGFSDIKSDHDVKFFTGIPTKNMFNTLFDEFSPSVSRLAYCKPKKVVPTSVKRQIKKSPVKSGPKRALCAKDQFLMTLMKCRLGLLNADLAIRFGVSNTIVSRTITVWRRYLVNELQCLIYHPEPDVLKTLQPASFKSSDFNKVSSIIDATEILIETPKNPVANTLTWSQYKRENTGKILVSILPNGQLFLLFMEAKLLISL